MPISAARLAAGSGTPRRCKASARAAVIEELRTAGHAVTGLARSDAGAAALTSAGIAVQRGSLEDLGSLRVGAAAADAVIHTAFNHDFSRLAENGAAERSTIDALGSALAGTNRTLIVTSGIGLIAPGRFVTEDDVRDPNAQHVPRDPELAAAAAAARGVRVSVIRLATSAHGQGDHGFAPVVIGWRAGTAFPPMRVRETIVGPACTAAMRRGSTVSRSSAPRSTPSTTPSPTKAFRFARSPASSDVV